MKVFILFFHFHSILQYGQLGQQSPQFCKFSFLLLIIIRSGCQAEDRLFVYINISKCHIFQDRYWFVLIPIVRRVKFQFLTQFHVDHLAHPVVSTLILSVLICCSRFCDWWFRLYHFITYICCFVVSSLWRWRQ